MSDNAWIRHVKDYQKKHNVSYREAMTLSRDSYKAKKLKRIRPRKRKIKLEEIQEQKGEGIKEIYENVKGSLLNALTKRPLAMINLLKQYGQKTISYIEVCRQPIMNIIRSALNVATGGDISKVVREKGYDNVFHLYCIVHLEGGPNIRLDKNQRVSIEVNPAPLNKEAVCKAIKLPQLSNLNTFIDKGEKLGNSIGSFWRYSAHNDNCQKFIKALLNASGVTVLDSFIMQDAGELVKPGLFRNIAQGITDAAALADYAIKGGKRGKKRKRPKMAYDPKCSCGDCGFCTD